MPNQLSNTPASPDVGFDGDSHHVGAQEVVVQREGANGDVGVLAAPPGCHVAGKDSFLWDSNGGGETAEKTFTGSRSLPFRGATCRGRPRGKKGEYTDYMWYFCMHSSPQPSNFVGSEQLELKKKMESPSSQPTKVRRRLRLWDLHEQGLCEVLALLQGWHFGEIG